MTIEPAKASSAARKASSTAFLARPVVARFVEPCVWFAIAIVLGLRAPAGELDGATHLLALFLVLRLCVDTSPNLVVAPRLEDAPYDQRRIRRGLSNAKLLLALAASIAAPLALHAFAQFRADAALVITAAGGFERLLLVLTLGLSSYSVNTPLLRSHRGSSIARPSRGPAAGALLALVTLPLCEPTSAATFTAICVCVAVSNLVVGGWQRLAAAAERLNSPMHVVTDADVRSDSRSGVAESTRLAVDALRLAPFLLLPTLPAVFAVALTPASSAPIAPLIALALAAIPPLAFDAIRDAVRFRRTVIACAIGLALSALLLRGSVDETAVLGQALIVVVAYLPAARAVRGGAARSIALAIVLYVLLRLCSGELRFLASTPLPELVFLVFATWTARGCGRTSSTAE